MSKHRVQVVRELASGRVTVDIDTPTLRAYIIDGQVQRWDPTPRQDIPADFDREAERRRLEQGGCCG